MFLVLCFSDLRWDGGGGGEREVDCVTLPEDHRHYTFGRFIASVGRLLKLRTAAREENDKSALLWSKQWRKLQCDFV